MRKYRNKIVKDRDGNTFHSARELARWRELLLLQSAGKIAELKRQVTVPLRGDRSMIQYDSKRVAKLIVDFVYREDGETVYEDTKGHETPASKLKRAIARAMGIEVLVTR